MPDSEIRVSQLHLKAAKQNPGNHPQQQATMATCAIMCYHHSHFTINAKSSLRWLLNHVALFTMSIFVIFSVNFSLYSL